MSAGLKWISGAANINDKNLKGLPAGGVTYKQTGFNSNSFCDRHCVMTSLKAFHRIKELVFAQNTIATDNYISIETFFSLSSLIKIWENQNFPDKLVW